MGFFNECSFTATTDIKISDLEFEKKVGEGGTGIVYKGHWKPRGLDVAIKTAGELKKTEVSTMQFLEYMSLITNPFLNTIGGIYELSGSPKYYIVLWSSDEDAQLLHCYW